MGVSSCNEFFILFFEENLRMNKLVLILILFPIVATAQELKTGNMKKEKWHHSLIRGYITANYLSQKLSYAQSNQYTDLDIPHGFSIGGGIKKVNATDPGKIGFRLCVEYSPIFKIGDKDLSTAIGYLKTGIALAIDRHINDLFVYHFDAGINLWISTIDNSYGAPAIGAGIGLRWCVLRVGYEYGLGNVFKKENVFNPGTKVQASTFSVGLIFYPTGI